nr:recombination endonuclease subunit [uncultured Mediterranean phage uvMED]|tara:strand:- start:16414 stop:18132 length:1719 start_codon:yes stop_codon:yes gene_type:complete
MILFEKIRWKNFLSTGNSFTEILINDSPSHLIIGSNGAGKSTLLDALCFTLFNKPFRKISKSQLVNSINERETVAEVEFSIGSTEYKVIRGIKPNIFEIHRNGKLLDQDAATKDTQKYLEQSVLKFNFKSFTQVVILGSSTFVPFMQLSAVHRREVIEDLLDIQVFSKMNLLLKDRIREANAGQKECEHQLSLAEKQVNMQRHTIDSMEKMTADYIVKLQDSYNLKETRITNIADEIAAKQEEIATLGLTVNDLAEQQRKHEEMRELRAKIKGNLKRAQNDLKFYNNNNKCPTCTQTLAKDLKSQKTIEAQNKVEKFSQGSEQITNKINDIWSHIEKRRKNCDQITTVQHQINSLNEENSRLLKECQDILTECNQETPDTKEEKKKLEGYRKTLKKTTDDCTVINKNCDDLRVVSTLLKDSGIKSKVISKFIPLINQRINKYLQRMDFFVNFTLDEEFTEQIKSRFRDVFSYSSFSEGEKQKIDLALLFTWRDIAKMKNSASTNLLILDEVFDSSLDSTATYDLMKILRDLDGKTNLFVISHKGDVLLDKFDTTLRFEKPNDFSKLVYDESP